MSYKIIITTPSTWGRHIVQKLVEDIERQYGTKSGAYHHSKPGVEVELIEPGQAIEPQAVCHCEVYQDCPKCKS